LWQTGKGIVLEFNTSRCLVAPKGMPKMILRYATFLFAAAALAGCCVSGNGCYSPLPGTPVAWDGLGSPPDDGTVVTEHKPNKQPKTKAVTQPGFDAGAAPDVNPHSSERLAAREASDRAADVALTKKLIICHGCSVPPARNDDPTGSVRTELDQAPTSNDRNLDRAKDWMSYPRY
jgi:hypothetical protein